MKKKATTDSFFGTNNMLSKEAVEYMRQHPLSLEEKLKQVEINHQIRAENERNRLSKKQEEEKEKEKNKKD